MPAADIRQRPGLLLGAAIVLHVGLISAQVSNATGLPLLHVVTFGAFAEVQRLTASVLGLAGLALLAIIAGALELLGVI